LPGREECRKHSDGILGHFPKRESEKKTLEGLMTAQGILGKQGQPIAQRFIEHLFLRNLIRNGYLVASDTARDV
jgi:hypothetical protein